MLKAPQCLLDVFYVRQPINCEALLSCCLLTIKVGSFLASFSYIFLVSIQTYNWQLLKKFFSLMLVGFELRISGIRDDRATNCVPILMPLTLPSLLVLLSFIPQWHYRDCTPHNLNWVCLVNLKQECRQPDTTASFFIAIFFWWPQHKPLDFLKFQSSCY